MFALASSLTQYKINQPSHNGSLLDIRSLARPSRSTPKIWSMCNRAYSISAWLHLPSWSRKARLLGSWVTKRGKSVHTHVHKFASLLWPYTFGLLDLATHRYVNTSVSELLILAIGPSNPQKISATLPPCRHTKRWILGSALSSHWLYSPCSELTFLYYLFSHFFQSRTAYSCLSMQYWASPIGLLSALRVLRLFNPKLLFLLWITHFLPFT